MSDSDSSLTPPPPSDEEEKPTKMLTMSKGKLTFLPTRAAPAKKVKPVMRVRVPSPSPEVESDTPANEATQPHEFVLADNPDIAFITMFRNRFSDAFPKSVPNIGPQDIERGVVDSLPSEQMENLLCALLGLALNRIKPVERGHHGRALEEAVSQYKKQWPRAWNGVNPLHGNRNFDTMDPTERLVLLKALTHWALSGSEAVNTTIREAYKQARKNDDLNQPMSVQPWGMDGRKRRYWLIEGHNDTPFRIFRESSRKRKTNTWWSVAGTIDEALELAQQLEQGDKAQSAQRLASGIRSAVPRLEETERKRARKQYRQDRRAAFTRPEPGQSLYEGRTRGHRPRYNYDDEDDMYGSETVNRRSARQSGTPVEDGPTFTASGRQVRSRFGRTYGGEATGNDSSKNASPVRDFDSDTDGENRASGRGARRSGRGEATAPAPRQRGGVITDEDDEDEEMADELSENAWEGDDNDVTGQQDEADDDLSDLSEDTSEAEEGSSSMVVKLRYSGGKETKEAEEPPVPAPVAAPAPQQPASDTTHSTVEPMQDSNGKADVSMADVGVDGVSQQENKEQVTSNGNGVAGITVKVGGEASVNGWH